MRSSRAVSEGSRRMISAICPVMLCSDFTSPASALLMLCNDASFGHASIRLMMS